MRYFYFFLCLTSWIPVLPVTAFAQTQDADIDDDDESSLNEDPVDEGEVTDDDVIIMEEDEDS